MTNNNELILNLERSECLSKETEKKHIIVLENAGNAPIIQNKKVAIPGGKRLLAVQNVIKNTLKNHLNDQDCIFLYCNKNFAPSLNSYITDLFNNFSINNELTIYYAITEVWG